MRVSKEIPDFIKMDVAGLGLYPKAAILVFSRLAQRAGWDTARIDRIVMDARKDPNCLYQYCRP